MTTSPEFPPRLFKILVNGLSTFQNYSWAPPNGDQPGAWMRPVEGELVQCEHGYHVTPRPIGWWVPGSQIYEVEVDLQGAVIPQFLDDSEAKIVVRTARLLREVDWADFNVWSTGEHTVSDSEAITTNGAIITAMRRSKIKAHDQATVYALDSTYVSADDDVEVEATDTSRVDATNHVRVSAHDRAHVNAHGRSNVTATGSSSVHASGHASITAADRATISADGDATVQASDRVKVTAYGYARVTASDDTYVEAVDFAVVKASGRAVVKVSGSANVEASGNVTVIVDEWRDPKAKLTLSDQAVYIDRRDYQKAVVHTTEG